MDIIIITGSNGLIGGDAVEYYSSKFDYVIGIDNNLREYFFGSEGSTVIGLALWLVLQSQV